jgi:hypothetical protein
MAPDAPDVATLARTRLALHTVAEHVLAPALYASTGHIGLRATPGGFGTPWFEGTGTRRRHLRIDGLDLVVEDGDQVGRHRLRTVGEAAAQAGIVAGAPVDVYPPATALEPDRPLDLDAGAAARLADLYATADQALAPMAAATGELIQLWPEHFDLSLTLDQVNYGASPGDADHAEPYLYVGPWSPPPPDGDFWNEAFGATIAAPATLTPADASAFFERGHARLS